VGRSAYCLHSKSLSLLLWFNFPGQFITSVNIVVLLPYNRGAEVPGNVGTLLVMMMMVVVVMM